MPAKPNGRFVSDVTIPDDMPIPMGQTFTKTWLVQNNGRVPWTPGFAVVFINGEAMTAQRRVPLPSAVPGQHVQISMELTAPNRPGVFYCDWRFQDDKGVFFGEVFHARIVAVQPPPAPTQPVNASYFVADVTIPDDTPIIAGTAFTKTWRVKNSGNQVWGPGYVLGFEEGTPMTSTLTVPVPTTPPGAEVNLSVDLKAPNLPGVWWGDWKLRDPSGRSFGAKFWLRIVVPQPIQAPVPAAPVAPVGVVTPAAPSPAAPAPVPVPLTPAPLPSSPLAPFFSQRDPRWSNIPLANMGGAPSIGRWGCLMTTLTMLAGHFGKNTTPDQFNRDMVARGGFINGYFTRWDALNKVYPDIIFIDKVDHPAPALISRIDASLQAGTPVPAMVDLTPQTAYSDIDQHWVLVVARQGSDYLIHDPANQTPGVSSLLSRYGKPGGALADAVRAALFYRR